MAFVETLCWKCDHACKNGCSWVDEFKPVPGWTAKPGTNTTIDSYLVIDCPEFRKGGRLERLDPDGANALVERILYDAARDFVRCCDEIGQDVERFIRSRDAETYYGIEDPDTIINALKAKRKAYRDSKKRSKKRFWEGAL